jgi:hypothetical protein
MDTDDLEPPKKNKLPPPVLEEMSIEELGEYIEDKKTRISDGEVPRGDWQQRESPRYRGICFQDMRLE